VSKLKRLLCYESQHQSQSNEKSLVQFDYEKAVSNYLGTQSSFKGALCVESIRLRISYNQNDETLSRNSLRYLSNANLLMPVN